MSECSLILALAKKYLNGLVFHLKEQVEELLRLKDLII